MGARPVDAGRDVLGGAAAVVAEHPHGQQLRARRDGGDADAVARPRRPRSRSRATRGRCRPAASTSSWTKSRPGRNCPARSGWPAATPVSTTAITAPAPVAVACAASDSTRSRFHCSPRRGSFAASAAAGASRTSRRARRIGRMSSEHPRSADGKRGRGPSAVVVYVITYRRMATAVDPLVVSVGPRVRALREAMDLSLRDLAERSRRLARRCSRRSSGGRPARRCRSPRGSPPAWSCGSRQLLRLDEDGTVTVVRREERRRGGARRPPLRDPHAAAARPARRGLAPHARARRRPPAAPATRRCTSPAAARPRSSRRAP